MAKALKQYKARYVGTHRKVINMNAKEYLQQLELIDAKYKETKAEIERIRSEIKSLGDVTVSSPWPDGQPRGTKMPDPTPVKAIENLAQYKAQRAALNRELQQLELDQLTYLSELWSKRTEVLRVISKIRKTTYYKLLKYKYCDYLSLEEIAVTLHYTYQYIVLMHGDALKEVQKILDDMESADGINRSTDEAAAERMTDNEE